MKQLHFATLLLLLGMARANATETTITGSVGTEFAGKPVLLAIYDYALNDYENARHVTDISPAGAFFYAFELPPNSLFKLSVGGEKYMNLGIEEAEAIQINRKDGKWDIRGSATSMEMRAFRKDLQALNAKYFDKLVEQGELAMSKNDQEQLDKLEHVKVKNLELFKDDLEKRIAQIKQPAAFFYALTFLDDNKNLDFLVAACSRMQAEYPDMAMTRCLAERVSHAQKIIVGSVAPDFVATDRQGIQLQLTDFRGKYLFVDFWASWCLPCRIEHPKLLAVYQKTPRADFDIIGVSQDDDLIKWENAIVKDALTWTQVFDKNQEISKLYGVRSLPQNILVDRNGEIIAKNLNAATLSQKLETLLK